MKKSLQVEPLTREAFAPFGEVIETEGAKELPVVKDVAVRFHALATVDVTDTAPLISIFHTNAQLLPITVDLLERHLLGSQAFVPLSPLSWLVVVAPTQEDGTPGDLRGFQPTNGQGVNLARGTWHAPILSLEEGEFLVVDRGGADNLDLFDLNDKLVYSIVSAY